MESIRRCPWIAPKTPYICAAGEDPPAQGEDLMSPEERQLLTGLFDRIRSAATTPRDQEAEALIQDATKAQPYAPYYLAQTVLVQDQALRAANDRLQELEGKVKDLEGQAASGPSPGGFLSELSSLFGGSGTCSVRRVNPIAAAGRLATAPARIRSAWRRARPMGRPRRQSWRRIFDGRARHRSGSRRRCASRRFNSRALRRA